MPDERRHLLGDLEHAHAGDPWHGASRAAILADVTARQAAASPPGDAHSIWQLVLHMEAWTREVTRRLQGGEPALPEMGDWPSLPEPTDDAWRRSLGALDAAHAELARVLSAFPAERLHERVGKSRDAPLGSGVTYAAMLRGLAQHDAYHCGQIAILKRIRASG